MKSTFFVAFCTLLILGGSTPPLDAAGMSSGIAVGVSSDGTQLVAGGNNRALYQLNPATLEVTKRVYLGRQVQRIEFTPSGKSLIVETTSAIQWIAADTLAVTRTFENVSNFVMVPAAGLVAMNYRRRPNAIKLYDIETAEEKATIPYESRNSVAAFGLTNDAKRLAILYSRKSSETEKKVPYKEIPKELKGADLNEFKQKNDGYESKFVVFDVETKAVVFEKVVWYGGSGAYLGFWSGKDFVAIGYQNQNARIDPEGNVTYFELANSYNYARGVSADGTAVLSGGLRSGTRTTFPDMKAASFKLDQLEGFPEYFKSFDFAADGTGYAGTTASRVVRIGKDGATQLSKPIF